MTIYPDGDPSRAFQSDPLGIESPFGVAINARGQAFVAKHCPRGVGTGDPIAPDTGYGFDGLTRNTGVAVDPSGNVWLTNNWLPLPIQSNPGGHEIVAYVGAAAPLKTPFFGPPVRK